MGAHARLKNEFTKDKLYHNFTSWLIYAYYLVRVLKSEEDKNSESFDHLQMLIRILV